MSFSYWVKIDRTDVIVVGDLPPYGGLSLEGFRDGDSWYEPGEYPVGIIGPNGVPTTIILKATIAGWKLDDPNTTADDPNPRTPDLVVSQFIVDPVNPFFKYGTSYYPYRWEYRTLDSSLPDAPIEDPEDPDEPDNPDPTLFTAQRDVVNFQRSDDQTKARESFTSIYKALDGPDSVALPNTIAAAKKAGFAYKDGWLRWFYGQAGNDTITGGELRDRIDGGQQNDKLKGEAKSDILLGGEDDDRLWGGSGADTLSGGAGNDTLKGDQGNDDLLGIGWRSKFNPGELTVESGSNIIIGGQDDDTLRYNHSASEFIITAVTFLKLYSGKGRNQPFDPDTNFRIKVASESELFIGTGEDTIAWDVEKLEFKGRNVPWEKLESAATLNWVLNGLEKFLLLLVPLGGPGAPAAAFAALAARIGQKFVTGTLSGDPGRGVFIELVTSPIDFYSEAADHFLSKQKIDAPVAKEALERVVGSLRADVRVAAGKLYDRLKIEDLFDAAGAASETLKGKLNEIYERAFDKASERHTPDFNLQEQRPSPQPNFNTPPVRDETTDITVSSVGPRVIDMGPGADSLTTERGGIVAFGGPGNDEMTAAKVTSARSKGVLFFGDAGRDTLIGSSKGDLLDGGSSGDRLRGSSGNDTYIVDSKHDRVSETVSPTSDRDSGGTDTVKALVDWALDKFIERLTLSGTAIVGVGNTRNNVITGNEAANILKGQSGNDIIRGGEGDDVVTGGLGRDILRGGSGSDRFDFNASVESRVGIRRDVVADFATGLDTLDLSSIDADTDHTTGNQAFSWIGAKAFSGADGQLRLANGIVSGDTDGDRKADFEIKVIGSITAADILL